MNQYNLRLRLISFIENERITQKKIAEESGVPTDIVSRFKNNRRELYRESAEALNRYLDSKGY